MIAHVLLKHLADQKCDVGCSSGSLLAVGLSSFGRMRQARVSQEVGLCPGDGVRTKHLLEARQQSNPFSQPCLQLLFINLA